MSSSPLVPFESGPPSRRERPAPVPYAAPSAPIHAPGEMGLESGRPLRDECWRRLSPAVRSKLAERAGRAIEWWASEDNACGDDRPTVVMLGEHGLVIAEPRIDTDHRRVYAFSSFDLEPTSFRRQDVVHRPRPGQAHRSGSAGPAPGAGHIDGLHDAACQKIGNLPPEAQELLQAPFLGGPGVDRCGWHYEGHANHLGMYMIYLAGPKFVTAAMGTKDVPVGHGDATAHWSLTCIRASVLRRRGI